MIATSETRDKAGFDPDEPGKATQGKPETPEFSSGEGRRGMRSNPANGGRAARAAAGDGVIGCGVNRFHRLY